MSPFDALATSNMLYALALLIMAGLIEPVLEHSAGRVNAGQRVLGWFWQSLAGPLFRAAAIAGFVVLAYPALYGLRTAPTIATLLAQGSLRLTNLVNVLFIISLVLPLTLPWFKRVGVMVPLQGIVATAMVFNWLTTWLGIGVASAWPGLAPAIATVIMIVISHRLAVNSGTILGLWLDQRYATDGWQRIVPNATELIAQIPPILYYGFSLGRQIAI